MIPTLDDFWAIFDEHYWVAGERYEYPPANPQFTEMHCLGARTDRKVFIMIKDIVTDQIWGVLVHAPDSWTESYKDFYVSGPVKILAIPRQITVYDYIEDTNG